MLKNDIELHPPVKILLEITPGCCVAPKGKTTSQHMVLTFAEDEFEKDGLGQFQQGGGSGKPSSLVYNYGFRQFSANFTTTVQKHINTWLAKKNNILTACGNAVR